MDPAGIETLLMSIYRNIDRLLIQFDFLTHSTQKGFFDDEIISLGGKIYSVVNPFSIKGIVQYQKKLSTFFKEHSEYSIVHSHMNSYSGMILKVAKKYGLKVRIAHSHTSYHSSFIKRQLVYISKILGKNTNTHSFACSKDAAKWSFGKEADHAIIFNNAIDTSRFKFSSKIRSEYRKQLNLEDKYIIGNIGRFVEKKNHGFLIDTFQKVHATKDNAVLLLMGDGPLLKEMQEKVKELELDDSVLFLGNRDDIEHLLCTMDIFVFPSIHEGLGIVAIEAQASGLNCLVSNTVPQEVKITPLLNYIPLEKGTDYWASQILNCPIYTNRDDAYLEVKKQGYDIKENTEWLKKFYFKCIIIRGRGIFYCYTR